MASLNNVRLLSNTVLTSNTAQINISGLSTSRQLLIFGSVRPDNAGSPRIHYRFNDIVGNYATFTLNYFAANSTEFGSAASSDLTYQNFGRFTEVLPSNRPIEEFTTFIIESPNPSDTSTFPFIQGKSSLGIEGANSFQYSMGQCVATTSALTSIQLFLSEGGFRAGSKIIVYGINP